MEKLELYNIVIKMTRETGQGLTGLVRQRTDIADLLDELVSDGKIVKYDVIFNHLPNDSYYLPTDCFSIYEGSSDDNMKRLFFIRIYLGIPSGHWGGLSNAEISERDDYKEWLAENESKLIELKNLQEVETL